MSLTITDPGLTMEGGMRAVSPVPAIGSAFGGGFVGAFISMTQDGVPTHVLIVCPKASQSINVNPNSGGAATSSLIDGYQNTVTGAAAGGAVPLYARNLTAGGYTDWYQPAYYEWDAIYYNLKPGTGLNAMGTPSFTGFPYGINPYAVPKRTTAWTTTVPAQTTVTAFQAPSGVEAFNISTSPLSAEYWLSSWWPFANSGIHYSWPGGGIAYISLSSPGPQCRPIRKVAL